MVQLLIEFGAIYLIQANKQRELLGEFQDKTISCLSWIVDDRWCSRTEVNNIKAIWKKFINIINHIESSEEDILYSLSSSLETKKQYLSINGTKAQYAFNLGVICELDDSIEKQQGDLGDLIATIENTRDFKKVLGKSYIYLSNDLNYAIDKETSIVVNLNVDLINDENKYYLYLDCKDINFNLKKPIEIYLDGQDYRLVNDSNVYLLSDIPLKEADKWLVAIRKYNETKDLILSMPLDKYISKQTSITFSSLGVAITIENNQAISCPIKVHGDFQDFSLDLKKLNLVGKELKIYRNYADGITVETTDKKGNILTSYLVGKLRLADKEQEIVDSYFRDQPSLSRQTVETNNNTLENKETKIMTTDKVNLSDQEIKNQIKELNDVRDSIMFSRNKLTSLNINDGIEKSLLDAIVELNKKINTLTTQIDPRPYLEKQIENLLLAIKDLGIELQQLTDPIAIKEVGMEIQDLSLQIQNYQQQIDNYQPEENLTKKEITLPVIETQTEKEINLPTIEPKIQNNSTIATATKTQQYQYTNQSQLFNKGLGKSFVLGGKYPAYFPLNVEKRLSDDNQKINDFINQKSGHLTQMQLKQLPQLGYGAINNGYSWILISSPEQFIEYGFEIEFEII